MRVGWVGYGLSWGLEIEMTQSSKVKKSKSSRPCNADRSLNRLIHEAHSLSLCCLTSTLLHTHKQTNKQCRKVAHEFLGCIESNGRDYSGA
jgi:hypothetical protein